MKIYNTLNNKMILILMIVDMKVVILKYVLEIEKKEVK